MKFWNYIGEFFLFRWISGKLRQEEDSHGKVSESNSTPPLANNDAEDDSDMLDRYNSDYYNTSVDNNYNLDDSFDDFHEEQDDDDILDDFDNDSFDDFHEEQDDDDILDDFFINDLIDDF